MKRYDPTPLQARRHLRRWSRGRKQLEDLGAPAVWQRIAVDAVLAELERLEEANIGMVITELAAWEIEKVEA